MIPLRDINPTRISPVVTVGLIAANLFVFFFVQPSQPDQSDEFAYRNAAIACELRTGEALSPAEISSGRCVEGGAPVFPNKSVYTAALISLFLHGGVLHVIGNMWFLWVFGNNVEEAFGRAGFLAFYLLSGLVATAGFVLINPDSTIPLVGASGAIAGVMGAYLVLFPTHRVLTIFFFSVVAIPSVVFLGLWFVGQFALVGAVSGVAWEAHVFGFLCGVVISLLLRPLLLGRTAQAPSYV